MYIDGWVNFRSSKPSEPFRIMGGNGLNCEISHVAGNCAGAQGMCLSKRNNPQGMLKLTPGESQHGYLGRKYTF